MKRQAQAGFTLVELSLSLAFISILLIAICTIVINITAIYQKGLAIKSVNTVGNSIVEEISSAITASSFDSNKIHFIDGKYSNGDDNGIGILCTDHYTYAWYDGNQDQKTAGQETTSFRLARFAYDGSLCNAQATEVDTNRINQQANKTELLQNDNTPLVIRDFKLYPSTVTIGSGVRTFYSVSFVLGTERGTSGLTAIGCSTDGSLSSVSSDFNFCAINQFNFAARPAGGDTL